MRITLEYAKEKFEEFNRLCFSNELPPVPIRINNSRRALGMFVHPRIHPVCRQSTQGECHLRFSSRLDLPQEDIDDTIIHEMIHYYIWLNNLHDTSSHGLVFRKLMDSINTRFNRHITISHKSSQQELLSDIHTRNNYICITHWPNNQCGITVCARTKIFEIHRIFSSQAEISGIEWYWSMNPWFNRFPLSRTPKIYKVKADELHMNLSSATACEIVGTVFRPKST